MINTQIRKHELLRAGQIAKGISNSLIKRNLVPAFSDFFLVRDLGMTLFIAVLDTSQISDHAPYIDKNLLHQIGTELGGLRVYPSNTTGIRYVSPLSALPRLPRKVELPSHIPSGRVALGMRFTAQPIISNWESLRHIAVLGQSGSGKSVFLRSLVYQAIKDGIQLLLADIDQTTFSFWQDHPNLLAPIATTSAQALDLMRSALAECDRRASLYQVLPGHPEKLSEYNDLAVKAGLPPLPRVLVVLDEASAVLSVMGGGKGELGKALATLGWRGRKFGIHFVYGAQEFTKDLVGPVREQVGLSICFKVRSEEMAKRMGCAGASQIPEGRPGLAYTDRFGPMQAYYVEKSILLPSGLQTLETLPALEAILFEKARVEAEGKLTLANIAEWGSVSQHQARKLQNTWALRGWVAKDARRDNSFCITPKTLEMLPKGEDVANQQTPQTPSNRRKPAQTQNQGDIQ